MCDCGFVFSFERLSLVAISPDRVMREGSAGESLDPAFDDLGFMCDFY